MCSFGDGRPGFPKAQQVASSVLAKSPHCEMRNSRAFLLMPMLLVSKRVWVEGATWNFKPPLQGLG